MFLFIKCRWNSVVNEIRRIKLQPYDKKIVNKTDKYFFDMSGFLTKP